MTVGLVVVSHSRALARAAVALAQEMLHGKQIRIAIAAGLDDTTFGTDAAQIVDAISGNIGRCTGYAQIVEAIALAAERMRGLNQPVSTA